MKLSTMVRAPRTAGLCARTLVLGLMFCAVTPQAWAVPAVSYVRDVAVPANIGYILAVAQGPIDPTDPLYNPNLSGLHLLMDSFNRRFTYDPATGSVTQQTNLPVFVNLDPGSRLALIGQGTPRPLLYIFSAPLVSLFTYNTTSFATQGTEPFVLVNQMYSMASPRSGALTVMADGTTSALGYSVDPDSGTLTNAFGFSGDGNAPGQFSAAYYHAYGPDGLLYVLDHGNNRVQSLDPDNSFAPVAQFAFHAGATTANMQFAIGPTGIIYLGDGLSGASAYDETTGNWLGSFTLPGPTPPDPFTHGIDPYLSADSLGNVFVFDHTGAHQYLDSRGVPVTNPALAYWRDLSVPNFGTYYHIMAQPQAPVDSADPLNTPDLSSAHWLIDTEREVWVYDTDTGSVTWLSLLPGFLRFDSGTRLAGVGQGTTEPHLYIFSSALVTLFDFNMRSFAVVVGAEPLVEVNQVFSMASPRRGALTVIADNANSTPAPFGTAGYSLDPDTGALTNAFGFLGSGNAPGEFKNADFHSYGPDGLLYVLDYGNHRMQSLDPNNGYALVGQFPLRTDVSTPNTQFAIGPDGVLYLGDGFGGGSTYDTSSGAYLGSFGLPGAAPADPFTHGIDPYVNADSQGYVFVFDHTGAHQYVTPAAMSFHSVTNVAPSTTQTSNTFVVSGIGAATPVSVMGGEYSIGCTASFVTGASTIDNGQSVCVRHLSSASFSTAVSTTLTIGAASFTYTSTTVAHDLIPGAFNFTDVSDVALATAQTSNAISVSGINDATPISVAGGDYSIGCTASFVSTGGTISDGQSVCVRHISSASFFAATDTTLTIGGVSDTFTSTTVAQSPAVTVEQAAGQADPATSQPIHFNVVFTLPVSDFTSSDVTVGGLGGISATSVVVTDLGIGTAFDVAVSGMDFSGNVIVSVAAGVAHQSQGGPNLASTSTDNDVFFSLPADTDPDPFTFTDLSSAESSKAYTSDVTVTGITVPTPISVTGLGDLTYAYSINGGPYTSSAGTVNLRDIVTLRVTSGFAVGSVSTASLAIGSQSQTWTVTTGVDTIPDALFQIVLTNVYPSSTYTSPSFTISGINMPTTVAFTYVFPSEAVTNLKYQKNGSGPFVTPQSGDILNLGDTLKLQVTARTAGLLSQAIIDIAGVEAYVELHSAPFDGTPDPFNFTNQSNVALGATVTSAPVTITGINSPTDLSIVGDNSMRISVDGGPFNGIATVLPGQNVRLRVTASSSFSTAVTGTLKFNGTPTASFTATTAANTPVDLSLNQSASANPIQTGSSLTYTATVHNNSASINANNLVLIETLAPGLTYTTYSSTDAWSCSAAGQVVTCNLAGLAFGASSSVAITADVGAVAGSIKTVGTVYVAQPDPALANNNKNITTLLCDPTAVDNISFGSPSFPATEGVPVVIAVNRSGNSCSNATVHYATTNGGSAPAADFTATSGDLTWLPLDANKKTFTVILANDNVYSGNRTVNLLLTSPSANAALNKSTSVISIKDDEVPLTIGLSTGDQSVSEEGGVATVTATLSALRSKDTTVLLTVTGTAGKTKDYTLSASSILIPAGQLQGSVTLTGLHDLLDEANETAIVKMGTVSGVSTSGATTNTITFTDDDATPTVSFDAAASTRAESKANAVTLVLSAASGQDVTVNVSSAGGSATNGIDYTINGAGAVVIPAGSTTVPAVHVIDDTTHESSETASFHIDSATNATPSGIQSTTLTITDNDP